MVMPALGMNREHILAVVPRAATEDGTLPVMGAT
jgi:hypothetical protein